MINAARVGGSTPSYTHALAVLGQYCNQQHARTITLAEVETGFLLHFFPKGQWKKPVAVDIHHTDLLELTGLTSGNTLDRNGVLLRGGNAVDKKHKLLPMGYDVFLRALGVKLDRRAVVGLTICETADKMYVNYWVDKATFMIRDGRRQAISNVQVETYDAAGVQALIRDSQQTLAQEASRYEQSMRLNQHDHITTLAAAFLFENDGKYRDAEGFFTRIASHVPQHPEAHYHVARLALMRGDKRAALQASRKAMSVVDSVAAVYDLHARILRHNGKHKEAVPAFERAVQLDPDNFIYRYHLSQAYEAVGRKGDAERLALSAGHEVAPDWEMVREEMESETAPQPSPAAAAQIVTQPPPTPSVEDAPVAEEAQDFDDLGMPAMTNPFGEAREQWAQAPMQPTPLSAQSDLASIAVPGAALPKLTVFDDGAVGEDWIQTLPIEMDTQPLLKPMTLEQRLRAAGNFPAAESRRAMEAEQAPIQTQSAKDEPATRATATADWPSIATQFPGETPPEAPATASPAAAPATIAASLAEMLPPEPSADPSVPVEPPASLSARLSAASAMPVQLPNVPIEQEDRRPIPAAHAAGSPALMPSAGQVAPVVAGSPNAVELAAEIMMIQRALDAEPNRADLHRKLGFLLARQGKTAEAATEFRKALQASRTNL